MPAMLLVGERAALGPLRRDLIPAYTRWVNDMVARRGLLETGLYTEDAETAWYEEASKASGTRDPETVAFTIHDARDELAVGTCSLLGIDYRLGTAHFGILVGERRGEGIGTDATRLSVRWAFTVLGLHNVMLEVAEWNAAAITA